MENSFSKKRWRYKNQNKNFTNLFDLLLHTRNLKNFNLETLTAPHINDLSCPLLFPQMQTGIERIFQGIKNQENILIFGDFDLDGISSAAIMFETLRALGANVTVWLPSREDGFGLSAKYVKAAIENKINLIITTDCGIANFEEIEILKKNGIDTIITDHHAVPDQIPDAVAIIHPKYPISQKTEYTGAGIAYKFAEGILNARQKITNGNIEKINEFKLGLLELATLGTIADLGELTEENRIITYLGIESLKKTNNLGIKELAMLSGVRPEEIDVEKIAFYIAPRLNAAGRIDHPMHSMELLLGNIEKAALLENLNQKRQQMTQELFEEAKKEIDINLPALILQNQQYHPGIIGLLAGKIAEQFSKPAIVVAENDTHFVASCRGPEDFDFAGALKCLSDCFSGFGGHLRAAGFSMPKENFSDFKKRFFELVEDARGQIPPESFFELDSEIPMELLTLDNIYKLNKLAPFGNGFPQPIFSIKNPIVSNIRRVGKNQNHLSCKINGKSSISFGNATMDDFLSGGDNIEIAFTPEIREWNGCLDYQLKVVDARKY